eukprot:c9155_g1_i3.p1 GENE.c9155_g1_i3~~c9155_g1_i3.p1  ORF type:complete len:195 (-),score=60.18 c9155_g1_i3:79-663(-)
MLLMDHGFTESSNPHDHVTVDLFPSISHPTHTTTTTTRNEKLTNKVKLFRELNLEPRIWLSHPENEGTSRIPRDILATMRAFVSPPHIQIDFKNSLESDTTPFDKQAILEFRKLCFSRLDAFPTKLSDDLELLAKLQQQLLNVDNKNNNHSRNLESAVQRKLDAVVVRVSEKKILKENLVVAKRHLATVKGLLG